MKTTVYTCRSNCNRWQGRTHTDCHHRESTIGRASDNQFDTDSLPPYDQLDPILRAYWEEDRSLAELSKWVSDETLCAALFDWSTATNTKTPAAPGVKITTESIGRIAACRITNRFRLSEHEQTVRDLDQWYAKEEFVWRRPLCACRDGCLDPIDDR